MRQTQRSVHVKNERYANTSQYSTQVHFTQHCSTNQLNHWVGKKYMHREAGRIHAANHGRILRGAEHLSCGNFAPPFERWIKVKI